jgi:hypothetical protein
MITKTSNTRTGGDRRLEAHVESRSVRAIVRDQTASGVRKLDAFALLWESERDVLAGSELRRKLRDTTL